MVLETTGASRDGDKRSASRWRSESDIEWIGIGIFGDDNDMETELDSKSSGAIYWRILLEQSTIGLVLAELIQRIGACSMGAVY